jgi:hypothetical protein
MINWPTALTVSDRTAFAIIKPATNVRLMQLDDQAFIYHSQSEKAVMALLRSVPYPIPTAAPVTQDGTVLTSAPVGVSRHTRDV